MPAITATVGAAAEKVTVEGVNNKVGLCFYMGLAAQPSTGKSNAQMYSQEAITRVEQSNKVRDVDSIQVNAATTEALLRNMKKQSTIICLLFSV